LLSTKEHIFKPCMHEYIKNVVIYAAELIGRENLKKNYQGNRTTSLFQFVAVKNEEFNIVLYKNNKEKWDKQEKQENRDSI